MKKKTQIEENHQEKGIQNKNLKQNTSESFISKPSGKTINEMKRRGRESKLVYPI